MFSQIAAYFQGVAPLEVDTAGAPTSGDIQLAATAILIEMANSDAIQSPEELSTLLGLLEGSFNKTEDEAAMLIAVADIVLRESEKLKTFIKAINLHFSLSQREELFVMVWQVILADKAIHNDEQRFARKLGAKLGLTRQASDIARERAFERENRSK